MDASENDDLHHAAVVAHRTQGGLHTDYRGTAQEFVSAAKYGFLYPGRALQMARSRAGTPTFGIHPDGFVTFIQNHDQIAQAGSATGRRSGRAVAAGDDGVYPARAGNAMLFMGQECAVSSPFLYFARPRDGAGRPGHDDRTESLRQFPSLATPEMRMPSPAPTTPARSSAASSIFRAETHAALTICIAICFASGATILCCGCAGRAASTARPSAGRRRVRFFGTATIACCWSTSTPSCTSTRLQSRCWRRCRAVLRELHGPARTPLRRDGHAPVYGEETGDCRAHPVLLQPAPAEEPADRRRRADGRRP